MGRPHVDDSSGYRFYDADQLERARLVAALRQLQMPLAEIKAILALEAPAAGRAVAEYWDDVESEHSSRRRLAAFLVNRINGKRSIMYEVSTREVPSRSLLCLKRNVTGWDQAWALGKEFVGLLRSRPLPRVQGPAGPPFCIYWSQVSEDSDGPLEWCRPVPDDQAEQLAGEMPELTLRTEPRAQSTTNAAISRSPAPPATSDGLTESIATSALRSSTVSVAMPGIVTGGADRRAAAP